MSDDQNTGGNDGGSTQGNGNPPANNPPQNQPPAQPPAQPHSVSEPEWARNLGTSIAALPEVIARSVKEAIGTPAPTQPKSPETKETKETNDAKPPANSSKEEPGKPTGGTMQERFVKWWTS